MKTDGWIDKWEKHKANTKRKNQKKKKKKKRYATIVPAACRGNKTTPWPKVPHETLEKISRAQAACFSNRRLPRVDPPCGGGGDNDNDDGGEGGGGG